MLLKYCEGQRWGVSDKRSRNLGHQVPPDLDHEVSVPDIAGGSGGAGPRCDSADMPGAGGDDRARVGVAGSHSFAGVGAASVVTGKAGAVREREVKPPVAGRLSSSAQEILGPAHVGAGLLLRDGGRSG